MKRAFINISLVLMTFLFLVVVDAYGKGNTVFVVAQPDSSKVNIGDRINLTVDVENNSGYEVSFPEAPQSLGDFNFVGGHEVKNKLGLVDKSKYVYVVSIYTTGTHVIPPIDIELKSRADQKWKTLQSPQVTMEVKSVLTGEEKDIMDIKGLVFERTSMKLLIFLLVGIVLGGAIFLFWKKKQEMGAKAEEELLLPHELAYRRLGELKALDLPEKGQIKEYYSVLSDIAREYLENRFSYRAPEMTTEEFLSFIKSSDELEKEHKELLKDFLLHCDMVKFAKYGPKPIEMLDSFKSAERLVDQTKVVEEEEVMENAAHS